MPNKFKQPDLSSLAKLTSPIWIVTSAVGDRRGGLVATMVVSASIVETAPRLLIGLAKRHATEQLVSRSLAFAAHLITADQADLLARFGTTSSRDTDKFSGLECRTGVTGMPILEDVLAWFECRVEQTMDTGDRTVYLGAVVAAGTNSNPNDRPMTTVDIPHQLPTEVLTLMKTQRAADAIVDAKSIADWRRSLR
ncbi:MAG: flavin reductase family protein [Planctomycetota bacterium]|nr:flavin reductase family protein [Planctomycetota bacterium]